jgi:hypothetical protein
MALSSQLLAAAASTGRVFATASLGAYLALGKAPDALTWDDLKGFVFAGLAALGLTAVNWLRKGETRFGTNAEPAPAPAVVVPEPREPIDG